MAILLLARQGRLRIVASPEIMLESEGNAGKAFGGQAAFLVREMFRENWVEQAPSPMDEELVRWASVTAEKDCHVLAAALAAGVDVLVTLDKKHLLTDAVRSAFPIPVRTPGEFLQALPPAAPNLIPPVIGPGAGFDPATDSREER
jgi:predicted nucleic acid-binding protein